MEFLKRPIVIRGMELANRLVLPPYTTYSAAPGHGISEKTQAHYAQYADAGLGLVIVEHCAVSRDGYAGPHMLQILADEDIPAFQQLTAAVKKSGTKIAIQLNHCGAMAKDIAGPTIGPSLDTAPGVVTPEKEATEEDLRRITEDFARAAARAVKAGFDAVEIHSAHGYLLNEFYSPLTNHRTDGYGGSLENRLRLHREILARVRETVGDGFPIFVRLGASDYMEGGNTPADGAQAAAILAEAGADLIDVSGGLCRFILEGKEDVQGYFADSSRAVRGAVEVPVILTGGIREGAAAEKLLAEGAADLIGVGRALIEDPAWARKALTDAAGAC